MSAAWREVGVCAVTRVSPPAPPQHCNDIQNMQSDLQSDLQSDSTVQKVQKVQGVWDTHHPAVLVVQNSHLQMHRGVPRATAE